MTLRCISPYKAGKGEDAVAYEPGDIIECSMARQTALLLDSPGSFEIVDVPVYKVVNAPADTLVTKTEVVKVEEAVTLQVEPVVSEAPAAPKKKGKGK